MENTKIGRPKGYDEPITVTDQRYIFPKDGLIEISTTAAEVGYHYIDINSHYFFFNDARTDCGNSSIIPVFKGQSFIDGDHNCGQIRFIPFSY